MEKTTKEGAGNWYKRWWGVIVAILFFPVFIIWYAWSKSSWSKDVKIGVTIASIVLALFILAVSPESQNNSEQDPEPTKASTIKVEDSEPSVQQEEQPKPIKPKVYTGNGDDVVSIQKPADGAAILRFECPACTSNTVVETNGAESLVVNEIGSYSGSHIIDVQEGSFTSKVTIKAVGSWKLTISGLDKAKQVSDKSNGKGDSVLYITGSTSEASLTNNGESNFVVNVYPESGGFADLAVNTIGSYKGTVPLEAPAYVQIISSGSWSVAVR